LRHNVILIRQDDFKLACTPSRWPESSHALVAWTKSKKVQPSPSESTVRTRVPWTYGRRSRRLEELFTTKGITTTTASTNPLSLHYRTPFTMSTAADNSKENTNCGPTNQSVLPDLEQPCVSADNNEVTCLICYELLLPKKDTNK